MPLMSMPRMPAATCSASSGVDGELHAAGLAPPADEDLGLDDDRRRAGAEDPLGRGTCLRHGVGDLPAGYGQALGDEQRLGVGFLDLHGGRRLRQAGRVGERWYRVRCRSGRIRGDVVARLLHEVAARRPPRRVARIGT